MGGATPSEARTSPFDTPPSADTQGEEGGGTAEPAPSEVEGPLLRVRRSGAGLCIGNPVCGASVGAAYMRPMTDGEKRPGRIYAIPTPPQHEENEKNPRIGEWFWEGNYGFHCQVLYESTGKKKSSLNIKFPLFLLLRLLIRHALFPELHGLDDVLPDETPQRTRTVERYVHLAVR